MTTLRKTNIARKKLQLVATKPNSDVWRKAAALVPEFRGGEIWLVGAGPGAPELLTLAALQGLVQAQHIFYDALIGEDLLALANAQAHKHYAGHRAGEGQRQTHAIIQEMIDLAHEGQKVMRLKGGDPYLFGRGAEEGAALFQARIPFRVVPGITAGLGGLAYAGIPLTHRDMTHAVTFITGHTQTGTGYGAGQSLAPPLDWDALAKSSPVLVIYMGLKHIGAISAKLCRAGRSPKEPAAIVLDASLPTQRCFVGTLGGLADLLKPQPKTMMGLIVVGPVVAARAQLDWMASFVPKTPIG